MPFFVSLPIMDLETFIRLSLEEDTGTGDHSSLAVVPPGAMGRAVLHVKDSGILAGLELARQIFAHRDSSLSVTCHVSDGDRVSPGDTALEVAGNKLSILNSERLVLNCMQRMSGIATTTSRFVDAVAGTRARILDTRKTTPLFRRHEKEAVRLGGGENHRMGLYDMIMLKDNHVDFAGGVAACLDKVKAYQAARGLNLDVEIEVRNTEELEQVLANGNAGRVMLDNFEPGALLKAIRLVNGRLETEASGGITLENVRAYAETGVDFISVGGLTHSYRSLDLSLKAG